MLKALSSASYTHARAFIPWPSRLGLDTLPMRVKDATLSTIQIPVCSDQFS